MGLLCEDLRFGSPQAEALDSQTLGSGLAIIAAAGAARAAAVQLALSGRGLRREETERWINEIRRRFGARGGESEVFLLLVG